MPGTSSGIGIGSPGNIDARSGRRALQPELRLDRTCRSARRCARSFALPVFVANDARCATLGEYTFGTGKADEGLRAA